MGFALSGGGIRSATFSLGIFQALARANLLGHVDYLSTVSGGGYFGAFLGALFARKGSVDAVEAVLTDDRSQELTYLRQNGAYLAPAGRSDFYLFATVLLRNVVTIHVVLAGFFLLLLLGLTLLVLLVSSTRASILQPEVEAALRALEVVVYKALEAPYGIVLSPWLACAAAILVLGALPLGWAYFTIGRSRLPSWLPGNLFLRTLGLGWLVLPQLILGVGAWLWMPAPGNAVAIWLAGSSLAAAGLSQFRPGHVAADGQNEAEGWGRYQVSRWLTGCLMLMGVLLALGLVDTVGGSLYAGFSHDWPTVLGVSGGTMGFFSLLASQASKLVQKLTKGTGSKLPPFVVEVLAAVGALTIGLVILSVVSFSAHAIAWGGRKPSMLDPEFEVGVLILAALVVGNLLMGASRLVLNQSAHQPLYASRLTRTYLGASNPERYEHSEGERRQHWREPAFSAATRMLPSDDLETAEYFGWKLGVPGTTSPPWTKGGPLHLVNVTINETIDGRLRTAEPSRRGLNLTLGPVTISVGARHHLIPGHGHGVAGDEKASDEHRVFEFGNGVGTQPDEQLTLGRWMGISGAAFSTGLGARTRSAYAFFAGLLNVRLGHWWRPGVRRPFGPVTILTGLFWVQSYLLREFLARFPGTSNRLWYLSDGGHFENMGAYELIRRQLDVIVIVDAEEDGDYSFEGLGNLVRKARLDFQTEIEFSSNPEDLLRGVGIGVSAQALALGSLQDLAPDEQGQSKAHAALAHVRYPAASSGESRTGLLLYIKPTLVGALPADLVHYIKENAAFPHEPTYDQFFGEPQWESYRKLGDLTGSRLFGSADEENQPIARLVRGDVGVR